MPQSAQLMDSSTLKLQLGSLDFNVEALRLPEGPAIDRLVLRSGALDVAMADGRTQASGAIELEAEISALSIQEFLSRQDLGGLEQVEVEIVPARMILRGKKKVALLPVGVEVHCGLEIRDQSQIWVVLLEVKGIAGIARGAIESALERSNPVFDGTKLPLPVALTFREVTLMERTVRLRAAVSIK